MLRTVVFSILCALVVGTARRIARSQFGSANGADEIIRTGILAFALIVFAGLALGSAGLIGTGPYLIWFGISFLAARGLTPSASERRRISSRDPADTPEGEPTPAWGKSAMTTVVVAVLLALLAFILAFGLLQSPFTLYDSLSYHLVFPARWLQEHRLSIIPTPFSDPAQAYQPSNGELFFLWLMLPFHGDVVARIGQVPFLLLGGVALYGVARRAGAKAGHALYGPTFYFLARPVVEQAVGADVDLISTAAFATSLYFGIIAVDTDQARDWAMWGISLGLFVGSKYLALIYAPVFLLFPLVRGVRLKSVWALPGVAAFGLPWYLRNWMVTGSPIYPASLSVAGITIARGAFSRDAMARTVFHATGLRLWSIVTAHAFGAPLVLFWLPFALVGAVSVLLRRRWWPAGFILLVLALMFPLEWLGLPTNIDSRFLLPAVAVGVVPLALTFGGNTKWNAAVHGLYLAGMIWILVGVNVEIRMSRPWYMSGWLSLAGLVNGPYLVWFAGLAAAAGSLWSLGARARSWRPPLAAGIAGLPVIAFAVGLTVWCGPSQCQLLQVSSPFIRSTMFDAWDWVAHNTRNAAFANTGNNVPYPLFGNQLTNRVYYVNIDRHAGWRLHDYARARARPGATLPSSPLALSSNELTPAEVHGSIVDASRPRYERLDGYRDAWIGNLKAFDIDHLFVSTLSAYEMDYVWHNEAGFPVEDEWARADPHRFTLVYENQQVRIYVVSP